MPKITDSTECSRLLFLAQGDSHLRHFMPSEHPLMPDLANRMLLGNGVAISDSYFSTSAEIATDLSDPTTSWTRAGLRTGHIVPAFRHPDVECFSINYKAGIDSTKPLGIRSDFEDVLYKLDSAFRGDGTRKIIWPNKMGVAFSELIKRKFAETGPKNSAWTPEQGKLWERTSQMRADYLGIAEERQENPTENGLQRASIFYAMAKDLKVADAADTRGIIESGKDKKHREALSAIILWIDELYNYNLAQRLNVKPYFPVGAGAGALMMYSLMLEGFLGAQSSPAPETEWPWKHTFPWPSDKMLRGAASPRALLEVRRGDLGQAYEKSMSEFHDARDTASWETFRDASTEYSRKICETFKSQHEIQTGREVWYKKIDLGVLAGLTVLGTAGNPDLLAIPHSPTTAAITVVTSSLLASSKTVREIVVEKRDRNVSPLLVDGAITGDIRIALPQVMTV